MTIVSSRSSVIMMHIHTPHAAPLISAYKKHHETRPCQSVPVFDWWAPSGTMGHAAQTRPSTKGLCGPAALQTTR